MPATFPTFECRFLQAARQVLSAEARSSGRGSTPTTSRRGYRRGPSVTHLLACRLVLPSEDAVMLVEAPRPFNSPCPARRRRRCDAAAPSGMVKVPRPCGYTYLAEVRAIGEREPLDVVRRQSEGVVAVSPPRSSALVVSSVPDMRLLARVLSLPEEMAAVREAVADRARLARALALQAFDLVDEAGEGAGRAALLSALRASSDVQYLLRLPARLQRAPTPTPTPSSSAYCARSRPTATSSTSSSGTRTGCERALHTPIDGAPAWARRGPNGACRARTRPSIRRRRRPRLARGVRRRRRASKDGGLEAGGRLGGRRRPGGAPVAAAVGHAGVLRGDEVARSLGGDALDVAAATAAALGRGAPCTVAR